jgi:ribosomal protein L37AE/L43A
MSAVRAVPFFCPFCGEQELRPADPSGWRCEACERRFELSVTGIGTAASGANDGSGGGPT